MKNLAIGAVILGLAGCSGLDPLKADPDFPLDKLPKHFIHGSALADMPEGRRSVNEGSLPYMRLVELLTTRAHGWKYIPPGGEWTFRNTLDSSEMYIFCGNTLTVKFLSKEGDKLYNVVPDMYEPLQSINHRTTPDNSNYHPMVSFVQNNSNEKLDLWSSNLKSLENTRTKVITIQKDISCPLELQVGSAPTPLTEAESKHALEELGAALHKGQ